MQSRKAGLRRLAVMAMGGALVMAQPALASCRVTDFTDRSLRSLNEVERLSFTAFMTGTEFDKLKKEPVGSPNYYALIANSPDHATAAKAARAKIADLGIENGEDFMRIWRSDFLTDEQLHALTECQSHRFPGFIYGGRPDGPGKFNVTLTHLTPVGVEEITVRLVASYNIANVDEIEAALTALGSADNFSAKTYSIRLADPAKRAVLIVRAGWETPLQIYIPAYPAPEVRR